MPLDQKLRDTALAYVDLDSGSTDDEVLTALIAVIQYPERISNTNRFASLLVDIGDECFITPLVEKIACGVPSQTLWLADYMYALIELLNQCADSYKVEPSFANLLGDWLLNTQGGEISWKAGEILSEIECPACKEYLLKGAADTSLFDLTRISCMRGIVNHFRDDARALLLSLADDPLQKVRDACHGALAHLDRIERKNASK